MAKSALLAAALLLPFSVWAQVSGAPKAAPGTVLTGEDSIIPAHTAVTVKTKEPIVASTDDNRMYLATVDHDVADTKGRVMIPKGSDAKILVQRTGTSLSLDLAAVTIDGQTYALIAGTGAEDQGVEKVHGSGINVPVDTPLTFRLDNPLMLLTAVK